MYEKSGIYTINPDGTDETNLTGSPSSGSLAWSPDGEKIAFTRDRVVYIGTSEATGNNDLRLVTSDFYVTNPDGSGETRLTNTPESETVVAWSPDGEEILLVADDPPGNPNTSEICVIKSDGTNRRCLVDLTEGQIISVAWARG